jgi:hypothetical protein
MMIGKGCRNCTLNGHCLFQDNDDVDSCEDSEGEK